MLKAINQFNKIKNKKSFIEKINIYVKLIDTVAKYLNLKINKKNDQSNSETLKRLNELNFLDFKSRDNIKLLTDILKDDLYRQLITAINFNIKYKKKIGSLLDRLDPIKRKIISKKAKNKKKYRVVDLFCGAGGFSYGFAQENFIIDLANDNDEHCIETYRFNHPEISEKKILLKDIRKVINHLDELLSSQVDVVVGGPPCQGFSYVNQQRIINDPRNKLYKYFIQAIKKIKPKIVVMENVKGMYPFANQVKQDIENIHLGNGKNTISYDVSYEVLVSDQFGVAQKRPRLIFIGVRKDISDKNKISAKHIFNQIKLKAKKTKKHVLKDALSYIKPLKSPRIKNTTETDDEKTGKKIDLNPFIGHENSYLKLINRNRKIDFVFNHKARYASDVNYQIFSTLNQGEDGTNEKIQHVMPYKHRNHIFKDKYFRLDETKPSKTITAHLRMDCLSHIHPTQIRTITPREAARIQSFPDDYFFLGPYLKTYMQIGNAVPPIMAKHIAKVIKKYLN